MCSDYELTHSWDNQSGPFCPRIVILLLVAVIILAATCFFPLQTFVYEW